MLPAGATACTDYEAVQEWQPTDGGATFNIVSNGLAVASGNPSFDTQPLGGVTLPGGCALGFGFHTAGGAASTFHPTRSAMPAGTSPLTPPG